MVWFGRFNQGNEHNKMFICSGKEGLTSYLFNVSIATLEDLFFR